MLFRLLSLVLLAATASVSAQDGVLIQNPGPDSFSPNTLLVAFKNDLPGQDKRAILGEVPGFKRISKDFYDTNAKKIGGRGPDFLDRLVVIELEDGVDPSFFMELLKENPLIERVELNTYLSIDGGVLIPNDPFFNIQWALDNTGQTGGTPDADIDAPEAWEIFTGSDSVVVGVLDTGINYYHPDLVNNIWINIDEVPGNGLDDDGNGYIDDVYGWDFVNNDNDPMDDHFHGTHCAGIIGANGNNEIGITGINWDVRLMALKFLGADGHGSLGNAIASLQYAINNGANVTSNSYSSTSFSLFFSQVITEGINAGIPFVAAAGNSNSNNTVYPAGYDGAWGVSATDHNDNKAAFSNYGDNVDFSAPGVNIYSCELGDNYRYASGTSMAAPHVAGVAACLLGINPDLNVTELEIILISTVDDLGPLGWDPTFGFGRINLYNAVVTVASGPLPLLHINSPENAETVVGFELPVVISASSDNLDSWQVDYLVAGENFWCLVASGNMSVENHTAGIIDISSLPDTNITIRLRLTTTENVTYVTFNTVNINNLIEVLSLPPSVRESDEVLPIIGSAASSVGSFVSYTLEYRHINVPIYSMDRIIQIDNGLTPIYEDVLGYFDVSGLSGYYVLRLTVSAEYGSSFTEATIFIDEHMKDNFPQFLGDFSVYPPSVGFLNSDDIIDIGVGSSINGLLSAYDILGNTISNNTIFVHTRSGSASFGDRIAFSSLGAANIIFGNEEIVFNLTEPGFVNDTSYIKTTVPMIADLDNDGSNDYIFLMRSSSGQSGVGVFAYNDNGEHLDGFPVFLPLGDNFNARIRRSGAVGDINGDGNLEIFFNAILRSTVHGTVIHRDNYLFGLSSSGELLPGYPFYIGGYDPPSEANDSSVNDEVGDIVLADLNLDGQLNLIFLRTIWGSGVSTYELHAINPITFESINGFPVKPLSPFASSLGGVVAIGDISGDEHPEIVLCSNMGFGSTSNFAREIAAVNWQGSILWSRLNSSVLPGSAYNYYSFFNAISIADIDGDDKGEIFALCRGTTVLTNSSRLLLLCLNGSSGGIVEEITLNGWQNEFGTSAYPRINPQGNSIEIGDWDNDGLLEVLLGQVAIAGTNIASTNYTNYLFMALDLDEYPVRTLFWSSYQGGLAKTGRYSPVLTEICAGDINFDGEVNIDDLIAILLSWGVCEGCNSDLDGNGLINVDDLVIVLLNWGIC